MNGLMMDVPLTITSIVRHAEQVHGHKEIVSITRDNPRHRYTYRECFARARQLANAMQGWQLSAGDRIATLAWNDYRHMETYYGSACSGYVCHTINPRLFPEQIVYIINHAEDRYVFLDPDFWPLIEGIASECAGVEGWVIMTTREHMPDTSRTDVLCYEDLLAGHSNGFQWPDLDEQEACSLCYTSGTTGNPKGVLYSHRSTVLHTYATLIPDAMNISSGDVILPIVPMFHVNAWGTPYACPVAGAKMVMPGNKMGDGPTLAALINEEGVTMSAGVPTVWLNLLAHLRESAQRVDTLNRVVVGGSACPRSVMEEFDSYGVDTRHAWGMTEMSPLGTTNHAGGHRVLYSPKEFADVRTNVGTPIWGVEIKIMDDDNNELPWDGQAFGALKVRGPWICSSYFKLEGSEAHAEAGWFETGDVATVSPEGFVSITDRTKDVIKSGGEWISSIEIENVATGHPKVAEAAVIGRLHDKWGERPLLIVVKASGESPSPEELKAYLDGKIAKWWIPDDVQFIEAMPHTATGKIQKTALRESFADYAFPS
ncbi:MAG: long-chain-fatty-acid--CoA ligase [Luminiphilus sp.]|jgi:3-(methylthio)propionyl---CoA ligase|nr:long-chain-fatty-acid--CoA ligase [Luminiphilus sp.]